MSSLVDSYWSCICDVDIAAVGQWLALGGQPWSVPNSVTKPQRIFEPPMGLLRPIIDTVLACFTDLVCIHQPMLSRVLPGQTHPMHTDTQRADWLTRVHVPITTDPQAWMLFEEEGTPVHFVAGKAYTFNTLKRHAFGNDGAAERVHFLFDVLRKDW